MSLASDAIAQLAQAGIRIRYEGDAVRVVGSPERLTPGVLRWLRWHKDQLKAYLTQQPAASIAYPDMCWHPDGSVAAANPVNLRALCRQQALAYGFPRLALAVVVGVVIPGGRSGWESFAEAAPLERVADALLQFDDYHEPLASAATSAPVLNLATGSHESSHVACSPPSRPAIPSSNRVAHASSGGVIFNPLPPTQGHHHEH
jgi:hypothetical protein